MSIKYDLRENPNPQNDGEKQFLHPRVISRGTIKSSQIFEAIAVNTGFSRGEMEGMFAEFTDEVLRCLSRGYRVEVGKMAYVTPKLKARKVMEKNEIRSQSISIDNVNFKTTSWFREHLKGTLVRAENGFQKSQPIDANCRKKILDTYLETHPFIKRTDYTRITGQLKNKAIQQLNEYVSQGILVKQGQGNQRIYLRAPQAESAKK